MEKCKHPIVSSLFSFRKGYKCSSLDDKHWPHLHLKKACTRKHMHTWDWWRSCNVMGTDIRFWSWGSWNTINFLFIGLLGIASVWSLRKYLRYTLWICFISTAAGLVLLFLPKALLHYRDLILMEAECMSKSRWASEVSPLPSEVQTHWLIDGASSHCTPSSLAWLLSIFIL